MRDKKSFMRQRELQAQLTKRLTTEADSVTCADLAAKGKGNCTRKDKRGTED
jgi:hypothetical protein